METGSAKDVSSEVSAQILEWPECILINNSNQDIIWGRPSLWEEVIYPKNLKGLDAIERYVCYLYYDRALAVSEIAVKLGHDRFTIDRIQAKIKELAWEHATPLMQRLGQ